MRSIAGACSLASLAFLAAGCAQNPLVLQSQLTTLQQEQTQLTQRNQELQTRANTLDETNQELESMLAQTRQQSHRLEEHLTALREQLRGATSQIALLMDEKQQVEQKAQAFVASTRARGGAAITANNSLAQSLPAVNIPGVEVRADGDVIRIELPTDRVFDPGSGRIRSDAGLMLDAVAAEVARSYPDQMIGVEGHTDADPVSTQFGSSHQLSTSQAMAVMDYLTMRSRMRSEQLFVIGHGPNHPLVSNATAAGKSRNRRVELVIYPERRRS